MIKYPDIIPDITFTISVIQQTIILLNITHDKKLNETDKKGERKNRRQTQRVKKATRFNEVSHEIIK